MDDPTHNVNDWPVFFDRAIPASVSMPAGDDDHLDLRIAMIEPDPRGYDPYNNAPPVPAEKSRLD